MLPDRGEGVDTTGEISVAWIRPSAPLCKSAPDKVKYLLEIKGGQTLFPATGPSVCPL